VRCLAIVAALAALLCCVAPARAYPRWWLREAACIHRHEGGWRQRTTWRGEPSRQHGGYQILDTTWLAFAPPSWPRDPAEATPAQQILVAWRIWLANGRRWGGLQWPASARLCGLG
jgi:hypothetical protein